MPDLGTQLKDHYDSVVTLIDPEDIIEGRVAPTLQRPPAPSPLRSWPGWVVALAAAAVVLIGVGGVFVFVASSADDQLVVTAPPQTTAAPEPGPTVPLWGDTAIGWSRVDSGFVGSAVTQGGPGLITVGTACTRVVDGDSVCEPGVWVSSDAANWQRAPAGSDLFDTFDPVSGLRDVAGGASGVVAVGGCQGFSTDSCTAGVWFSPDGITWDAVELSPEVFAACPTSNPFDCSLQTVVNGGPGFVISGRDLQGPGIWTSKDGRDWNRVAGPDTLPEGVRLNTGLVVLGSRLFATFDLVGAADIGTYVSTSLNGIDWEPVPDPEGVLASGMMRDLVAWKGGLAAPGRVWSGAESPDVLWTSPDGLTWSHLRLPAPEEGASYGGVVAGGSGLIIWGDRYFWTSNDGNTWERHTADPDVFREGVNINELIWHEGVLVGLGSPGIYLWNPDQPVGQDR